MYHLGRLAAVVALVVALWRLMCKISAPLTGLAWFLLLLGGGLGWLALPSGELAPDLWVAEAFPFLSAYSTPHFGLGLALLVGLLTFSDGQTVRRNLFIGLFAGAALAVVAPFGAAAAGMVLLGVAGWELVDRIGDVRVEGLRNALGDYLQGSRPFWRGVGLALGGVPLLAWQYQVILGDPLLAGWNGQNLTPSPPLWQTLTGFAPVWLLAIVGSVWLARNLELRNTTRRALVVWAVAGLSMAYVPWGLQRRMFMGWYVPLTLVGIFGLAWLVERMRPALKFAVISLLVVLVLPSNLVVLLGGLQAVRQRAAPFYLPAGEMQALGWLATQETYDGAVVLSSCESGAYIPAFSGLRVVCGHPFETVNYFERRAEGEAFWGWTADAQAAYLAEMGVMYVFYGAAERAMGAEPKAGVVVWEGRGGVRIYRRE